MGADLWTIVLMRGIERSKSRLAAAVGNAGRARLNRWLLVHTLKAIERWRGDLKQCMVVSPCDQALELARRTGAAVVREIDEASDPNRAAALGLMHATANGARKVLVLCCDLPELTAESLHALTTEAVRPQHMVIAPDIAATGTNALLVDTCPDIGFSFGERSYSRHCEWAAARGWTISTCTRPELGFDLDTPQDLAAWLARQRGNTPGADAENYLAALDEFTV